MDKILIVTVMNVLRISLITGDSMDISFEFNKLYAQISESLCLKVKYSWPESGYVNYKIELFNAKPNPIYTKENIYSYYGNGSFEFNPNQEINRRRNISKNLPEEFCVLHIERRDFMYKYFWRIGNKNLNSSVETEFTLPLESYYKPAIHVIQMDPAVPLEQKPLCLRAKYTHHPLVPIRIYRLRHSLIESKTRKWLNVFEIINGVNVYYGKSIMEYRIDTKNKVPGTICVVSVCDSLEGKYEFQWEIVDLAEEKSNMRFFIFPKDNTKSNVVFHELLLKPPVSMFNEPACAMLNYSFATADIVKEVSLSFAYPDTIKDFNILFTHNILNNTYTFSSWPTEIISRINKYASNSSNICFTKIEAIDNFCQYRWIIRTLSEKVKHLDFSLNVVTWEYGEPILKGPNTFSNENEFITLTCEIDNVSPEASLQWLINGQTVPLDQVHDIQTYINVTQKYLQSLASKLILSTEKLKNMTNNVRVECTGSIAITSNITSRTSKKILVIPDSTKTKTFINKVLFDPITPTSGEPFCIVIDFEIEPGYFLFLLELSTSELLNTTVYYRHQDNRKTYPNGIDTNMGIINKESTIYDRFCFSSLKAFPLQTLYWRLSDDGGGFVANSFNISVPSGCKSLYQSHYYFHISGFVVIIFLLECVT